MLINWKLLNFAKRERKAEQNPCLGCELLTCKSWLSQASVSLIRTKLFLVVTRKLEARSTVLICTFFSQAPCRITRNATMSCKTLVSQHLLPDTDIGQAISCARNLDINRKFRNLSGETFHRSNSLDNHRDSLPATYASSSQTIATISTA